MDPRRKPQDRTHDRGNETEAAGAPGPDEPVSPDPPPPDGIPENGDFRYDVERSGELPGEDDDNAYQNSDEALPDDSEEAAISRHPSREGGRFDEI